MNFKWIFSFWCLFSCGISLWAQNSLGTLYQELQEKLAQVDDKNIPHYEQIAEWCSQNGLKQSEKKIYQKILEQDPSHTKAHQKLGHFFDKEQWYLTEDAMMEAKGKRRGLTQWIDAHQINSSWHFHHHYWLTANEYKKIQNGEVLVGHRSEHLLEVLSREYLIQSKLDRQQTLELAKIIEQAIRFWREESNLPYQIKTAKTLQIHLLKNHQAFQKMVDSDRERFSPELKKAHGYFDGQVCHLAYFHDRYRTQYILIHEGRHQYDDLVVEKFYRMPKWYSEGLAEYYSQHKWEKGNLKMGGLYPEKNYSLFFLKKLWQQKKILTIQEVLQKPNYSEINPAWYQNIWGILYYLKTEKKQNFAQWESDLLAGKLTDATSQMEAFQHYVAPNLEQFQRDYQEQLEKWIQLSPKNIRK